MKYRIKIITYKNGRKEFFPQKRCFLCWKGIDFEDNDFCAYFTNTREEALLRIDKNLEGNCSVKTINFEYINK